MGKKNNFVKCNNADVQKCQSYWLNVVYYSGTILTCNTILVCSYLLYTICTSILTFPLMMSNSSHCVILYVVYYSGTILTCNTILVCSFNDVQQLSLYII